MVSKNPKKKDTRSKGKKIKQKTAQQWVDEIYSEVHTLKALYRKKKGELSEEEIKEFSKFMQQKGEDVLNLYLLHLHNQYQKTKNPLFAWEAFDVSKEAATGIQKWIVDYFSRCADILINLENFGDRPASAVYSALEMKSGSKGVFVRYQQFKLELKGCYLVLKLKKENPQRKLYDDIYADIGEKLDVKKDTIKNWHRKHKELLEPIVDLEVYGGISILKSKNHTFGILHNPPSK